MDSSLAGGRKKEFLRFHLRTRRHAAGSASNSLLPPTAFCLQQPSAASSLCLQQPLPPPGSRRAGTRDPEQPQAL